MSLGLLEEKTGNAVVAAAQEVIDGGLDEHFVLDIFQTGSGTSTNTNANEVIANRASQILGGDLGSKLVHPNDHVNMGQSSNDVIPTSIHLAALLSIKEDLIPSLHLLADELNKKSVEFWPIVKTGRTHLQDATPVRLGQEFKGFAGQAEYSVQRLQRAQEALAEVALGGTAVGTGVNTHEEFSERACKIVSEVSGVLIKETANHFQAQATLDGLVEASGELKTIAISLHKIANDIRFIASGPRAGLGEITLPEVQPGSSIMPGKINPVIAESVIQVVAQVVGNDATVTLAGQGGYFELNTMMPVAAYNILQSISLLAASAHNFADQCVQGITATSVGPDMVEKGLMLGTALAPAIGYDAAAAIAKEASAKGTTIREMAKLKTELSDAELDELLKPESMTEPGIGAGGAGGGG
jgi:fumarate hydratase class II